MKTHFSPQLIFDVTSLEMLSPLQLHVFLQMLIRYEHAPGGPYLFPVSESERLLLNQHIAHLFKTVHKPLPNVEQYIAKKAPIEQPAAVRPRPHSLEVPRARITHLRRRIGDEAYATIKPLINRLGLVNESGELTELSVTLAQLLKERGIALSLTKRSQKILGEANFLIWIAYSLYDTILDETAATRLLPIANQVLRCGMSTYLEAGVPFDTIDDELRIVDQANAHEVNACRAHVENGVITLSSESTFQDLVRLQSERSLVHCLGPLFIIENTRLRDSSHEAREIFKEYCAVRQLNDDIHDWQEDLINGHITYPVQWLLNKNHTVRGSQTLTELIPALQSLFWKEGLTALVSECLERALKVRQGYKKILELSADSAFDTITIAPIIDACHQALEKHTFEKAFLNITHLDRSTVHENRQSI